MNTFAAVCYIVTVILLAAANGLNTYRLVRQREMNNAAIRALNERLQKLETVVQP